MEWACKFEGYVDLGLKQAIHLIYGLMRTDLFIREYPQFFKNILNTLLLGLKQKPNM
jgi:hypothetical protein